MSSASPAHDPAAVRTAALKAGFPLRIVRIDDARAHALYGAALVLIRPDQHVAWRGNEWSDDLFARVTGQSPALPATEGAA